MSEEILINTNTKETRVALIEAGVLQEIHIERHQQKSILGNIYMGKVVRVLPGMQSAFVDIGLPRAAFLHVSDIVSANSGSLEGVENEQPVAPLPAIDSLVVEGQAIVVQVIKDPIGSKGARLTTRLSISTRYLVYMPGVKHIGVSVRIEDEAERARLHAILSECNEDRPHGFIVRTAAEGVDRDEILQNQQYILQCWQNIAEKIKIAKIGECIYEDLPLLLRALRDFFSSKIEKVRIDDSAAWQSARTFIETFMPHNIEKLEHHDHARPLFDLYDVETEIEKALSRKVPLQSGGHLIFDQTEAMTTIDVNTGGFVGHRNVAETILKTNLEAAHSIARQLRLRNLGGVIIIDFIDMHQDEHKAEVVQALQLALSKDNAKTAVLPVSAFGLVEMTRKRTRESLERVLCEECPMCEGRGTVPFAVKAATLLT